MLAFQKDLDAEQLGGFVRWIAPADVSQVRASGRCRPNTTQLDVVVPLAIQKLSLVSQATKFLTRWLGSQQLMRTNTHTHTPQKQTRILQRRCV